MIARPVASRTTIVRHKGQITNWNDDRGFGFITPAAGGEQVFVHIKSFVNRGRRPAGSDIVTYEVTRDRKALMLPTPESSVLPPQQLSPCPVRSFSRACFLPQLLGLSSRELCLYSFSAFMFWAAE